MSCILFLSVRPPLPAMTTNNNGSPFSRRPNFSPIRHSSSLFSFSSTTEQPSPDAKHPQSIPDNDLSFSRNGGCKGCGKEQVDNACNGEGRIQGGIATVPGFGWWPIKAYRPCPGFLESGGRYKRQGQSMDEVAFGKNNERQISLVNKNSSDTKSSKKKQSLNKLKR